MIVRRVAWICAAVARAGFMMPRRPESVLSGRRSHLRTGREPTSATFSSWGIGSCPVPVRRERPVSTRPPPDRLARRLMRFLGEKINKSRSCRKAPYFWTLSQQVGTLATGRLTSGTNPMASRTCAIELPSKKSVGPNNQHSAHNAGRKDCSLIFSNFSSAKWPLYESSSLLWTSSRELSLP